MNNVTYNTKILVGNSVYEQAEVTIYNNILYIKFISDDLDDICINFMDIINIINK